jgi:hypothetical protein
VPTTTLATVSEENEALASVVARYEPAEMSPFEFEGFVAGLLGCIAPVVDNLRVTAHERIHGVDGSYDFDATMRYRPSGMDFLVAVEAKHHRNPIKREFVQVLHSKAMSVGAQKAVLIATAPFQSGAIELAKIHGVALVLITEGRFTYETRSATPTPVISREDAWRHFRIPVFVGVHIGAGDSVGPTRFSVIEPGDPERVAEALLPSA